jgi:hypothetical protein
MRWASWLAQWTSQLSGVDVSLATPGRQTELVNGLTWDKPLAMLTERLIQGLSDVPMLVAVIFR